MSRTRILFAAMILSSVAFGKIYYVSNDGSDTNDGSISNPFATVMAAYYTACTNGDYAVIQVMPGTYVEEGTLILSNSLATIRGSGAGQSSLQVALLVTQTTAITDIELAGQVTNDISLFLSNVKLALPPTSPGRLIGTWQWSTSNDQLRIRGVAMPEESSDPVTLEYLDGDWHVGSASNASHIIMENDSGFIMAKTGSGFNLRLMADHANGGQIVMHSPVSMPGMAGHVTSVDTSSGYLVSNNYCRETSVVMITPLYDADETIPVYSVAISNNSFTVHGDSSDWSFNYLIMHP